MLRNTYGGFNTKEKELGDRAQGIANGLKYFCHPYCDYKPAQVDNHGKVLLPTDCSVGCLKRVWSSQSSSSCVAPSVAGRNQGIHRHLWPCQKAQGLHGSLGSPQSRPPQQQAGRVSVPQLRGLPTPPPPTSGQTEVYLGVEQHSCQEGRKEGRSK